MFSHKSSATGAKQHFAFTCMYRHAGKNFSPHKHLSNAANQVAYSATALLSIHITERIGKRCIIARNMLTSSQAYCILTVVFFSTMKNNP